MRRPVGVKWFVPFIVEQDFLFTESSVAKREELAAQGIDPDAWFEKQRREADEAVAAR
jgi:hypothetical protein